MEVRPKIMMLTEDKETKIAEFFLRSFEEKSPLDYDILDSMLTECHPQISEKPKN